VKPPRVLDPRNWQTFTPEDDANATGPATNGPAKNDASVDTDEQDRQSRKLS
jgi:hypothetical protein